MNLLHSNDVIIVSTGSLKSNKKVWGNVKNLWVLFGLTTHVGTKSLTHNFFGEFLYRITTVYSLPSLKLT